jgi:uncharacterized membrane-anchored protein YhcB (DUF1043 family)
MENNEDNKSYNSLLIGIIGSIIGGLIIYRLLKSQSQQSPILTQAYQMQDRIQQLEYQLYQNRQYHISAPVSNTPITGNYTGSYTGSYKNNEKWAITRNKDGFISNIEVLRDAKVS